MKIAIWHNLPSGGGKRALYDHVRGLIVRGHMLESWCPSTADPSFLPLSTLVTEHIYPLEWKAQTSQSSIAPYWTEYQDTISLISAMDAHCRRCADDMNVRGFDLLYVHPCRFFGVSPIARYVRIPRVLYLQEPYRYFYEAMPQLPWIALTNTSKRRISLSYVARYIRDIMKVQGFRVQARQELLNAKAFDLILANSLFSRESILRAYGLDSKVCYLGIDTSRFTRAPGPPQGYVVGLGAFVESKNIQFVIESMALLDPPRPRLVWIGDHARQSYVEQMEVLARRREVDFEPHVGVSDSQLVTHLSEASLLAYAPRLEPFGYAPLEANACELPVVAVAEGGVRETVIDGVNGLTVDYEPRAMVRAMSRVLASTDYARTLGGNGRALVLARWSLESAIDRVEQRLTEVLERRASSNVSNS